MTEKYLFKSERLGFRNWVENDIAKMAKISADPEVMEYFPTTASVSQTEEFVNRMMKMYDEKSYCYYAVDRLSDSKFIGFIGLCDQTYESPFTPCIDIGWRLDKEFWGMGYATEGAKQCLEYAFNELKINDVKAVATLINIKSISVMKKIGMVRVLDFDHSKMLDNARLKKCVCYEIKKEET
jgi:RimJ/RimL family protein N-acetyltransferase